MLSATIDLSLDAGGSVAELTANEDDTLLYLAYGGNTDLAVVDIDPVSPTFNQEVEVIQTTGSNFTDVAVLPGSCLLMVSSHRQDANQLLFIDTNENSFTFHFQIGFLPLDTPLDIVGLQDLPDGIAYVANLGTDMLSVVELIGDPELGQGSCSQASMIPEPDMPEPDMPEPDMPTPTVQSGLR